VWPHVRLFGPLARITHPRGDAVNRDEKRITNPRFFAAMTYGGDRLRQLMAQSPADLT
jgi:hypothetical protein